MKLLFTNTFYSMLSLLLFIAIGWGMQKGKIVPENAATTLSKLENYLLKPVLIIKTFMTYCNRENFIGNWKLIVFMTLGLALSVAIAFPLSLLFGKDDKDERKIFRYSFIFPNSSFIGYAIVPMILGEEALYGFILFNLPGEIFCNSWGYMNLIPEKSNGKTNSVLKRIFNPCFISLIIGIIIGTTGIAKFIPDFLKTALGNIGACMSPVAMIMTGMVIAAFPLKKLITNLKVFAASLFRLIIIPTAVITVYLLLTDDSTILLYGLFTFAMPFGLNTIIVPKAYDGDPEIGASEAIIGDLISILTIPCLYVLLNYFI